MNLSPLVWVLIVLGAAGLIFLIVKLVQAHLERERQRKAALAGWGAANGFRYADGDPCNLDGRYQGVADIGTGHDRYALETLTRDAPVPCAIFRYHYKTWETRTVTENGRTRTERYEATHWKRYLVAELGSAFPTLMIRPETMLDRVAGFVGFDDIDFESEEFSKRYFVKSDDRQFAYALIHPQMMEWMLASPFQGQLVRGLLVIDVSKGKHTADGCQQAWAGAVGFVNRVPPFVWQDYAKRDPLRLPDPVAYVPPTPPPLPPPPQGASPVGH